MSVKFSLHFLPGKDYGARVAIRVGCWVPWLREVFNEVDREVSEEGQVECVKPDHRFLWVSMLV